MKKIFLLATCAVLAMATKAQTNIDELKYLQNMFGMEKKQLVAERMNISKADSAKFWSLYEDYELYRSEISEKRANNVQQFADNYKNITNAKADEILKNTFEISNEQSKLWQRTYDTMSKALSPVIAGKFIYLEMYIEALGRERLSEIIPNIGNKK